MSIFDIFAKKEKFTEEEISLLNQHKMQVDDSRYSAVRNEHPDQNVHNSVVVEKYRDFYLCKSETNIIIGMGLGDVNTMNSGHSEKYLSFDDVLSYIKK